VNDDPGQPPRDEQGPRQPRLQAAEKASDATGQRGDRTRTRGDCCHNRHVTRDFIVTWLDQAGLGLIWGKSRSSGPVVVLVSYRQVAQAEGGLVAECRLVWLGEMACKPATVLCLLSAGARQVSDVGKDGVTRDLRLL
jgi:hypothetical protein